MNAREAAARWIATWGDERITTYSAASYVGGIAWSYAEPIGVLLGDGVLYVTNAKFSVTTSKHTGQIRSAAAIAGVSIVEKDHGVIRGLARELNQGGMLGGRGAHYDRVAA